MGSRWDLVWEEAKQDAFILGFLLNLLGDEMELLGIAAWVGSTGDRIALPNTCFLWGLGLLATTGMSTTDVQKEMDPTTVYQHHFHDCYCRNHLCYLGHYLLC